MSAGDVYYGGFIGTRDWMRLCVCFWTVVLVSVCVSVRLTAETDPVCVLQIEDDLLHPNPANEKRKHKLKRLVQAPNSFFMDVKCPGCFNM